jgi:hypothetical protein
VALLLAAAGLAPHVQASDWDAGAGAAPPGSAASYRVYLSAGGGLAEHETDCLDRQGCRRSSGAARATLALMVIPGLALEAVAVDFGHSAWQRPDLRVRERPRLLGFGFMAPMDVAPRLVAELRGGIGRVAVQRERQFSDRRDTSTQSTPQFYLGAALVAQLGTNAGVHFAVDASLAELEQGTARVNAASLGLTLRF